MLKLICSIIFVYLTIFNQNKKKHLFCSELATADPLVKYRFRASKEKLVNEKIC